MNLGGQKLHGKEGTLLAEEESPAGLRGGHLALGMAVLLALLVGVTACGASVSGAAKGKQIYATNCSNCHGETGARIPAAQLDAVQFIAQLGDAGLTKAISEGKGTMPAWGKGRGGPLSDDQVRAVVEYLKLGGDVGPLPTGPGRSMYARQCAGCHGDRGNRIPAADLSSASFVSSIGPDGVRVSILDGKGTMPAFGKDKGGPFSDEQARQVAEFVKALGRSSGGGLEASLSSAAKEGKDLYGKNCGSCHGDKGNRIPATPMNDKSYVQKLGESNLTNAIANGKGTMPAYGKVKGGPLSDAQVKSLVAYVNDLAGVSPSAAAAPAVSAAPAAATTDGHTLYSKNCAACHGDKGSTLSNANLSSKDFIAKLGDSIGQAVTNGKGAMPGFKGKLKDDEVKNLVEYVKSLPGTASSASAGEGAGSKPAAAASGSSGASGAATQPAGGPPGIPHDTAGRDQCSMCHAAGGMKPVPSSHDGRTNNMCQACHKARGAGGAASGGSAKPSGPPGISHTLQGREGVCLSCHGAGGMKPVPASHQGRTNDMCTACHKAQSGSSSASAPAAGGTAASAIPKVTHVLQGREGFCLKCHGPDGIATLAPADHAGRTNDMCLMCHQSTATTSGVSPTPAKKAGPPVIPHKVAGHETQCLECHGQGQVVPAPVNHKGVTVQQCLKCHNTASEPSGTTTVVKAPPKAPDTHAGRTNDTCTKCHDPQFPGIP